MHPTDGMWQEDLDGESEPAVQRYLRNHLASCPDCQVTVTSLMQQHTLVTGLLGRLGGGDVPVRTVAGMMRRPRTGLSREMLTAAAIILCLVTAAGATVRTGLLHRIGDWVLGPRPWLETPRTPPPPPTPAPANQSAQSGVAFEPSGEVEIVFQDVQSGGSIEVVLSTDSKVSIVASAPVGYSVRKGRVTIANRGATASYRITLPRSVPLASIRVADRLAFSKHGSTLVTGARADSTGNYVIPFSSQGNELP